MKILTVKLWTIDFVPIVVLLGQTFVPSNLYFFENSFILQVLSSIIQTGVNRHESTVTLRMQCAVRVKYNLNYYRYIGSLCMDIFVIKVSVTHTFQLYICTEFKSFCSYFNNFLIVFDNRISCLDKCFRIEVTLFTSIKERIL